MTVTVCTHQGRHRSATSTKRNATGGNPWRLLSERTRSMSATRTRKERMMPATSIKANGWAKVPAELICDTDLSDGCARLYGRMRLHAWESDGSTCKVRRQTLAAELGWGLTKFDELLAELETAGWIVKRRTGRGPPTRC